MAAQKVEDLKSMASRLIQYPFVLERAVKEGHPLQEERLHQSDEGQSRRTQSGTLLGGFASLQKDFGALEPALKPVPKSINETVENRDSSTVDYTGEETNEQVSSYPESGLESIATGDPSTGEEDRERETSDVSVVVSHPEGGPVSLPEGTRENGNTSTGDDGEIEALAVSQPEADQVSRDETSHNVHTSEGAGERETSVVLHQPEAGQVNHDVTNESGNHSAREGGEGESNELDEEGEPDATSQPCSPTTANAAPEFVIPSTTLPTSHTSGVATAPPTQGAQPYDSGVPSSSSLEAQGFSEDDPKPKPDVLGPETTKPIAVGRSGGGLTVVVYPSKDKPVQEENGGEDELRRRIAELEKDSSDKDAKCEQLSAQCSDIRAKYERRLAKCKRFIEDDSQWANCSDHPMVRESSEKRVGYALLLFNSFKVGGLKKCEHAESEAEDLEIVLRTVGYEVRLVRDSNEDTMMKELRDIKKHFKEGDRHVFVFISTHGGCSKNRKMGAFIRDNDGGKLYKLDETLYDIGKGVKKPILACVDTCRGEETLTVDELPSVCIFYSSMPGYSSHEAGYGSPFVKAICAELQGYRRDSLYTILCRVSDRVRRAELYDCDASGTVRVWQVPEMKSTVCQDVYLSDEAEKVNSIQQRSSI